jgi:uncharacterized protein (DUF433 family)
MKRDIYGGKDPRDLPAYTVTEAARYLDLAPSTLRQWVDGRSYATRSGPRSAAGLIVPAGPERPLLLSFHNLVESHVLAGMRLKEGIAMHKVREALALVSKHLKVERPLLSDRFLSDGAELFFKHIEEMPDGSEKREHLIDVTGARGQVHIPEITEVYMRRIQRDVQGVPIRLFPVVLRDLENEPIMVDPRCSFGRPVVAGTGVPTFALAERYRASESIDELAKDFRLDREKVRVALRYEREAA